MLTCVILTYPFGFVFGNAVLGDIGAVRVIHIPGGSLLQAGVIGATAVW